jgi:hypothetical protein
MVFGTVFADTRESGGFVLLAWSLKSRGICRVISFKLYRNFSQTYFAAERFWFLVMGWGGGGGDGSTAQ